MPAVLGRVRDLPLKPPVSFRINRADPLAQGLDGAFNYTNGDASTLLMRDMTESGWGVLNGASAPAMKMGNFGSLAPSFAGTTDPGYNSQGSKAYGGAYTWVTWFTAVSVPSGAYQGFLLDQLTRQTFGFSWSHTNASFKQAAYHRDAAGTYTPCQIASTLAANTPYQIAGVYDGATIKCYLNGRLENSVAASPGSTSPFGLRLASGTSNHSEIGTLDHFLIWNGRALTANDIYRLYERPFCLLRPRGLQRFATVQAQMAAAVARQNTFLLLGVGL